MMFDHLVKLNAEIERVKLAYAEKFKETQYLQAEIERLKLDRNLLEKKCLAHQREIERFKYSIDHIKNSFRYKDGDALNEVARELPENYKLTLTIFGNGGGTDLELFDADGGDITPELSDELYDQVEACIECAKNEVKS